ncbi:hypothetical protein OSTOST_01218 [Ostertagia ostertagi]
MEKILGFRATNLSPQSDTASSRTPQPPPIFLIHYLTFPKLSMLASLSSSTVGKAGIVRGLRQSSSMVLLVPALQILLIPIESVGCRTGRTVFYCSFLIYTLELPSLLKTSPDIKVQLYADDIRYTGSIIGIIQFHWDVLLNLNKPTFMRIGDYVNGVELACSVFVFFVVNRRYVQVSTGSSHPLAVDGVGLISIILTLMPGTAPSSSIMSFIAALDD